MTDADKRAFDQAINRLCVALRSPALDVAEKRVYFEKLKALEIEFVAMAADQLADTLKFFPKTSEWREAALKVERDRRTAQIEFLRNLPEPLCVTCGDTTWAPVKDGPAVRPCACRPMRRLELLGRRPLPMLPESTLTADPQAAEKIRAIAARLVKPMPSPSPVAQPERD